MCYGVWFNDELVKIKIGFFNKWEIKLNLMGWKRGNVYNSLGKGLIRYKIL